MNRVRSKLRDIDSKLERSQSQSEIAGAQSRSSFRIELKEPPTVMDLKFSDKPQMNSLTLNPK